MPEKECSEVYHYLFIVFVILSVLSILVNITIYFKYVKKEYKCNVFIQCLIISTVW